MILIIGPDDFAECPECGARLEPEITNQTVASSSKDSDGPIHQGTCPTHGTFQFQIDEDDE